MNDTRSEFIVESREHLAVFERSLLSLEKAASGNESRSLIQYALRAVHSLKGDSGFLGFATIRQLAHAMESVLEDYRDGARLPSTDIVEALLAARDQLAALVEDLDHSQQATVDEMVRRLQRLEGTMSHAIPLNINLRHWLSHHCGIPLADLFAQLDAFGIVENPQLTGLPDTFALSSATWAENCDVHFSGILMTKASPDDVALLVEVAKPGTLVKPALIKHRVDLREWQKESRRSLVELFREIAESGELVDQHLTYSPADLAIGLPTEAIIWHGRSRSAGRTSQFVPPADRTDVMVNPGPDEIMRPAPESPAENERMSHAGIPLESRFAENKPAANTDAERLRSLRINVELLDRLMNLVSELTLIRNQTQVAFSEQEGDARNLIQRLNSVTSELQDTVLQTRMQPVGNLFGRFPRMVRDLAATW
ncbi:MAG: Hpt domain-containing protein [Planctomycetaceae bacterium]